eukprot:TRINITY_DN28902_c0_g1_i1.p3 TRINITY_DN28902_c0_g1~~TRINITY_DN28902_c0_g1_i1.p3  ORF type:complete len:101 (-),score=5.35 TRINITY_DN28902_c0_g1_i1:352-654(-)
MLQEITQIQVESEFIGGFNLFIGYCQYIIIYNNKLLKLFVKEKSNIQIQINNKTNILKILGNYENVVKIFYFYFGNLKIKKKQYQIKKKNIQRLQYIIKN